MECVHLSTHRSQLLGSCADRGSLVVALSVFFCKRPPLGALKHLFCLVLTPWSPWACMHSLPLLPFIYINGSNGRLCMQAHGDHGVSTKQNRCLSAPSGGLLQKKTDKATTSEPLSAQDPSSWLLWVLKCTHSMFISSAVVLRIICLF